MIGLRAGEARPIPRMFTLEARSHRRHWQHRSGLRLAGHKCESRSRFRMGALTHFTRHLRFSLANSWM
jgi:hypothetical protein